MANLTREQEWADRNHDRRVCWFPENGGCLRHNPNIGQTFKSDEQKTKERMAELQQELHELNVEYNTNYELGS